ncbi:MAG: hypothetical protein ABR981_04590 [Candidatus Micrarchaeaceae archaeon]|jgi:hypothetical protein
MVNKVAALKTQLPSFVERPYGGNFRLDASSSVIVINPHKSTAEGISNKKLKDGLRGHDGIAMEHVKFLRYADSQGDDGNTSLSYTFENDVGAIITRKFKVGDYFLSVYSDGKSGFWHVLENDSDRPIMLMISSKRKLTHLARKDKHDH